MKIFKFALLLFSLCTLNVLAQTTMYVSPGGSNTSPYADLTTAATSIQTAVDAAVEGAIILVDAGTYTLTSNISVTKKVTIRSIHGFALTTIDGNNVTRCFYIDNANAVIDGFTITNGYNPEGAGYGGGVNIVSGGTVQNCLITNNQARDGGGVAIDNNGLVQNCIIRGNKADNNIGQGYGGGIRLLNGGTARNCLVVGNTSVALGGGINIWNTGTIQNCTVSGNTAPNGAGVRCRNNSTMENTISFFNNGSNWVIEGTPSSILNNCTTPALPAGTGNITSDPMFVNSAAGDYHLAYNSPCINAGITQPWMGTARDLGGFNRILAGAVDIGAYEYLIAAPVVTSSLTGTVPVNPLTGFVWTAVYPGAQYELDYSIDGGLTWYNWYNGTGLSFNPTGLLYDQTYNWRLRSKSGPSGPHYSVYVVGSSFYTQSFPVPVLVSPLNTLTGVSILPNFTWTWSGINGSFILKIYDGAALKFTSQPIQALHYQLLETDAGLLLNGHKYTWTITAIQGTSSAVTAPFEFTTTSARTLSLNTPTGGTTVYVYQPVLLSWICYPFSGSFTYKVQYLKHSSLTGATPTAADWANSSITTTINAGTNSMLNSVSLLSGTKYWWRVAAYNGSDAIVFSNAQWFLTAGGAAAVTVIPSWPVGGNLVYTNSPDFYWYSLSGNLVDISFDLMIDDENTFTSTPTSPVYVYHTANMHYSIPAVLKPGTLYYWKVITYYKYGTADVKSEVSAIATFKTNGQGTLIQPVASYPINVMVYTQSPSFYWYLRAAASGITYSLYIDGVCSDAAVIDKFSIITGRVLSPGEHTWYIKASNGTSEINSVTKSFTVAGGIVQGAPKASWPVGNPTLYTTTPILSWTVTGSTIGLTKFRIAWSTTPVADWNTIPASNYVEITDITLRNYTMTTLPFGTHLYWAVAAASGTSFSAWSAGEFTITGAAGTLVPIVSYPKGGVSLFSNSVLLSWYINGSSVGIQHYKVEYGRTSNFSDAVILNNITTQSVTVNSLVSGATYYWRVSSFNGTEYSTPSNPVGVFTVNGAPGAVVPIAGSPVDGVELSINSPMLSWALPTMPQNALKYEIQYAEDPEMNAPVTVSEITNSYQVISGLESGKSYFWKVRSVDEKGQYSAYSSVAGFTVKTTTGVSGIQEIPSEFRLGQNYPNPFNPSTLIEFALPKNSVVTIKVYDLLGREIKTLVSGSMNAGEHLVGWNGDDNAGNKVTSGTYLCRMCSDGFAISRKMVLLK